jgi:hypothetical protein
MPKRGALIAAIAATLAFSVVPGTGSAHDQRSHPAQHGSDEGHLIGTGASGDIEFVGRADVTDTEGLVADLAVDPRQTYVYAANWGRATCNANSEAGGINNPDAGAWVIDISDPSNPTEVGFIPHSQDSRPGEGMQVIHLTTKGFDGYVLVMNNEQCGKNGKGGVTLIDVTNPLKPKKLSSHFGDRGPSDTNDIHSAFAWDAGAKAYVVMTDNEETADVDILDISNPKRPRLIGEFDLDAISADLGDPIFQPEIGLDQSFLHDMVVKNIDGTWTMLLSYWDGGYVQLDVDDPANPVFLRDTDYNNPDPELVESAGITLPPEGNGHQNEFTSNNEFFIGTDEDFSPYRTIFSVDVLGERPAGEFGWTVPIVNLPDQKMNGPTVYGGYGCPQSPASDIPDPLVAGSLAADEEAILVLQRGPVGDSSANYEACFFSEKVEAAQEAGYGGAIIVNHHTGASGGAAPDAHLCGSQGHAFTPTIPGICTGHRTFHEMFGSAPNYASYPEATPAIGTVGERVEAEALFDGWGYPHLFDAGAQGTAAELDTYAIPEAHMEGFAQGFGDLTVHEVATHPTQWDQAYLSYYAGGIRSLEIQCGDPDDKSTCDLVETGSYLDPDGNNFWGVETFVKDGHTYVLGSDRDDGVWIFEDTDDGI